MVYLVGTDRGYILRFVMQLGGSGVLIALTGGSRRGTDGDMVGVPVAAIRTKGNYHIGAKHVQEFKHLSG